MNKNTFLLSIRTLCVLVFLLMVFICSAGHAEKINNANVQFTSSDKVLTIAVNRTTYPYHFVNKEGDVDGLMVDLLKLWAKKNKGLRLNLLH